jgi:hypothetical protein
VPQATIDSIEAALFAQLATLLATASPTPGPFAHLARFAIERGAADTRTEHRGALAPQGKVPAALLAFEREQFRAEVDTSHLRRVTTIGRSTWQVWVVASELGGDAAAVKGGATTGVYALASAVCAALAGLPIADTHRGHRVELLDVSAAVARRGQYIAVARVASERLVESVALPDDSVPLTGIDADLNLVDADGADPTLDGAGTPFAQLSADTTDP